MSIKKSIRILGFIALVFSAFFYTGCAGSYYTGSLDHFKKQDKQLSPSMLETTTPEYIAYTYSDAFTQKNWQEALKYEHPEDKHNSAEALRDTLKALKKPDQEKRMVELFGHTLTYDAMTTLSDDDLMIRFLEWKYKDLLSIPVGMHVADTSVSDNDAIVFVKGNVEGFTRFIYQVKDGGTWYVKPKYLGTEGGKYGVKEVSTSTLYMIVDAEVSKIRKAHNLDVRNVCALQTNMTNNLALYTEPDEIAQHYADLYNGDNPASIVSYLDDTVKKDFANEIKQPLIEMMRRNDFRLANKLFGNDVSVKCLEALHDDTVIEQYFIVRKINEKYKLARKHTVTGRKTADDILYITVVGSKNQFYNVHQEPVQRQSLHKVGLKQVDGKWKVVQNYELAQIKLYDLDPLISKYDSNAPTLTNQLNQQVKSGLNQNDMQQKLLELQKQIPGR